LTRPLLTSRNIQLVFGVSCVSLFIGASVLHHGRGGKRVNMATNAQWFHFTDLSQNVTPADKLFKAYGIIYAREQSNAAKINPKKMAKSDSQGDVLLYACKIQEKTMSGKWKTKLRFIIKKSDLGIELSHPETVREKMQQQLEASLKKAGTGNSGVNNNSADCKKQQKELLLNAWQKAVEESVMIGKTMNLIMHGKDHPTKSGTLIHTNMTNRSVKLDKDFTIPTNKKEFMQFLKDHDLVQFAPGVNETNAIKILKLIYNSKNIAAGREVRIRESVIREGEAVTVYGTPCISAGNNKPAFETEMLSEEDDNNFICHLKMKQSYGYNFYKAYIANALYLLYEIFA
jgi:hypothetical protein